jgi:transcriptional regulator with XRE-family HTH domain
MQKELKQKLTNQNIGTRNGLKGQIRKAPPSISSAIEVNLGAQPESRLVGRSPSHASPTAPFLLRRKELVEFHLLRVKVDENDVPRSRGYIRNQRSNANNFLDYLERRTTSRNRHSSPNDPERASSSGVTPLSREFSTEFNNIIGDYALHLSKDKRDSTINDRISTARALRESYITFKEIRTESESFGKTLKRLVDLSGMSFNELALKSGVSWNTVTEWCAERYIPMASSLWKVQALEDTLKVPGGTLSSIFPDVYWEIEAAGQTCDTAWSEHHSKATQSKYFLRPLTPRVLEEWTELVRSFTDPNWSKETGLPKNSMWRIRWNNGKCATAEKNCSSIMSFFGFMRLPTDSTDPMLWGLGMDKETFTLGMVSNVKHVKRHLEFLRQRTLKKLHTETGHGFIHFFISILRPKTGYLWQHTFFGERLPEPIPPDKWHEWCETNRAEMVEFEKRVFGKRKKNTKDNKKNEPKLSDIGRDPFAQIRDVIESRDRPITLLFELSEKMDEMAPLDRRRKGNAWAVHCRDKFFIDLMPSNPLRCENQAMMTYIPKDWSKFKYACDEYKRTQGKSLIYVETDPASNLYQKSDCTWHLRFNPEDFKNEDGAAGYDEDSLETPYDVPLPEDITPAVCEYIFRQRLVLLEDMKVAINKLRKKHNLPSLSELEEKRIDRCPYVFRPTGLAVCLRKKEERVSATGEKEEHISATGAEQVAGTTVSSMIRRRMRRLLKRNISSHACRHLVASDLVKAFPDGMDRASVRLHITVYTVGKHYAWVRMADKVKPLNEDLVNTKRQWKAGKCEQ